MPNSDQKKTTARRVTSTPAILPGLFGGSYGQYEVRPANFVLSMLLHALVAVLLIVSGHFAVVHRQEIRQQVMALVPITVGQYIPPGPLVHPGAGGGGGDRDKLQASQGGLPKLARQQLAPPAVVIRIEKPQLPVEPTIIAPPELKLPASTQLGDPFNGVLGPPSNGRGSRGGIGDGQGTGVGPGNGPGAGPGAGGGVYVVGGNVSAPRVLYDPDPEFSDEARRAKHQGTVLLWLVVGPDGRAHDIRIARSLGMGLDEKAIAAVLTWRFDPARMNGTPVPVQINVAVNFQLH